jgi:hypothetical protein
MRRTTIETPVRGRRELGRRRRFSAAQVSRLTRPGQKLRFCLGPPGTTPAFDESTPDGRRHFRVVANRVQTGS